MIDTKTNELSTPFFANLNGLRFVGALFVFLFHCFTLGREHWGAFFSTPIFTKLTKFFSKGHHGVDLFFVLSGFLITYLLIHEASKNKTINAFGFFMRRLLRIWPLYFLLVFFGFFIFPYLPYGLNTSNSLLNYSLFLSNFEEIWNGWRDSVNFLSVTWSISIEEQFYLSWVLLIAIFPPMRKGKYFGYYFTFLILISLFFRWFHYNNERVLYFHTFSVMSDLAIGGYLSYLCFNFGISEKLKNLRRGWIILIYTLGIALILFAHPLFPGRLIVMQRIAIAFFFSFVIFEQVYCLKSFYKVDKIPGFFKLGEISYGLYIYHCVVIYYVQQIMLDNQWNNSVTGFILFVVISALLTFCLSWLSYRYFERPLLRLKRYFR